jgi:hypothetical protein
LGCLENPLMLVSVAVAESPITFRNSFLVMLMVDV